MFVNYYLTYLKIYKIINSCSVKKLKFIQIFYIKLKLKAFQNKFIKKIKRGIIQNSSSFFMVFFAVNKVVTSIVTASTYFAFFVVEA